MNMEYYDQIQEPVAHINKRISQIPEVAVVLGSGLGNFSESIDVQLELSYAELPHFPPATVKGHDGKLIFGLFKDVPIVAQAGRYHFYEGYGNISPCSLSQLKSLIEYYTVKPVYNMLAIMPL